MRYTASQLRYLAVALVFLGFSGQSIAGSKDVRPDDYVVPYEGIVAGKSLHEYVNTWWQWAYTMGPDTSAIDDLTGEHCGNNQNGPVWFLAGGYGSSKIKRSCTIPYGNYVFFPVINTVFANSNNWDMTCEQALELGSLNAPYLSIIDVQIDNVELTLPEQYRITSTECFDLAGMIPESEQAAGIYPSAADGYWIMFAPLPRGEYVLEFGAQYRRDKSSIGSMVQDIEYRLTIE